MIRIRSVPCGRCTCCVFLAGEPSLKFDRTTGQFAGSIIAATVPGFDARMASCASSCRRAVRRRYPDAFPLSLEWLKTMTFYLVSVANQPCPQHRKVRI